MKICYWADGVDPGVPWQNDVAGGTFCDFLFMECNWCKDFENIIHILKADLLAVMDDSAVYGIYW